MGSFRHPENRTVDQELYEAFVEAHEAKLRLSAVPECKWRTLCQKLSHSVFDAGENFVYLQEESSDDEESKSINKLPLKVYTKCSMTPEDADHIYLIDHAWTYTLESAKRLLEENLSLIERMAAIMEVITTDVHVNKVIEGILKKMWQYNNCYIVESGNQTSPTIDCFYILDEFGSRIHYSEDPSFEIVPFFYCGDNLMYSLLYPKYSVSEGEEVTVSYPGHISSLSEDMKRALMFPWSLCNLTDIDFDLHEPSVEYFASGRHEDILPESSNFHCEDSIEQPIEVFSEYPDIAQFLTHSSFKMVDKKELAAVFWLASRQYNIKELLNSYEKFSFISQFPSEHILINKDLLAAVCRRHSKAALDLETLDSHPDWLPTTFNFKTELPKFVSYFQHRQNRHLDNIWICKPFNLARGLGIHITNDLAQITRLSQVRPMVACKYITDPVLFPDPEKGLVKMDLRYIVLLRSIHPLELYVYERFWLRFANKPFVLDNFSDYETHFTVMNYNDCPLQQMFCHDFIEIFENHYTSYKWCDIQENINKMIKDIFIAATMKEPPAGLGNFRGSRAMYGLDVMLRWDRRKDVPEIKPMILEVNWMPDCKRACHYYPEFYNDVFSILFLNDTKDKHSVQL